MGVGAAQRNQTSNQTSGGSLVSLPHLPHFSHFPFHFPFRGEKGSGLQGRRQEPQQSRESAATGSFGRFCPARGRGRLKNAQGWRLRGPKHRNPWAFPRFGPPPPRQAAGDPSDVSTKILAHDRDFFCTGASSRKAFVTTLAKGFYQRAAAHFLQLPFSISMW